MPRALGTKHEHGGDDPGVCGFSHETNIARHNEAAASFAHVIESLAANDQVFRMIFRLDRADLSYQVLILTVGACQVLVLLFRIWCI